ncbi:hypothetical protein [Psychrobacter ciconiae]|uniref:hypothetical protein n=1 Tax=Psychrobacter ciconiae TaxID=1553449 RepID=UPI001917ABE5|nr:hypothetical protein [Psychrobacter ciconiae]
MNSSLLKSSVAVGLIAAMLGGVTGCMTTPGGYNAYGDIYEDIYKDSKIYKKHKKTINTIDKDIYRPAIEQTAANRVSNMGYQVRDVRYKKGDRTIRVKANRGNQNYKIDLDYPSYNVIRIKND